LEIEKKMDFEHKKVQIELIHENESHEGVSVDLSNEYSNINFVVYDNELLSILKEIIDLEYFSEFEYKTIEGSKGLSLYSVEHYIHIRLQNLDTYSFETTVKIKYGVAVTIFKEIVEKMNRSKLKMEIEMANTTMDNLELTVYAFIFVIKNETITLCYHINREKDFEEECERNLSLFESHLENIEKEKRYYFFRRYWRIWCLYSF